MTANDGKSYLSYLNKLVDQYNNYHCSIHKKLIDADCSALTEEMNQVIKPLNLHLMIKSGLLSIRIILEKVTLKNCQERHLLLVLCWKPIHWHIKLKI